MDGIQEYHNASLAFNIANEKQVDITKVIMYGYNYEHKFIYNVWDGNIADHLQSKFNNYYEKHGATAVFFIFYTELSQDNRTKLVRYILNK